MRKDLQDYHRRIRKYNDLIGIPNTASYLRLEAEPKSVSMLKYLTADYWPEKFLVAVAPGGGPFRCQAFYDFAIESPALEVDIAVVENLSGTSILIDQFNGSRYGDKQLREVGPESENRPFGPSANHINHQERYTLGRSQKLIVPLRLVFRSQSGSNSEYNRIESQKTYREIRAAKPGAVVRYEEEVEIYNEATRRTKRKKFVFEKVRESFKPPEYPEYVDYAFGPEWSLSGLAVDGEIISFGRGRTNAIAFTSSSGAGSCPILYAWDDKEQHFWRWGKVLHRAQSRARTETQSIRFDGCVSSFRISEEELEVTHLSSVRAFVVLKDGSEREATPNASALGQSGDGALMLAANEAAEFSFSLPVGIAPEDVIETRLAVTGYYERYSTLLARRLLEQRGPQSMKPKAADVSQ